MPGTAAIHVPHLGPASTSLPFGELRLHDHCYASGAPLSNECGRSVEPRHRKRLVAVWQPGSGIAVHNVKSGVFHLFVCVFQNPILVSIVAPFELGLGTRNPRFVACMVVDNRNRAKCWPANEGW